MKKRIEYALLIRWHRWRVWRTAPGSAQRKQAVASYLRWTHRFHGHEPY